MDEIVVQTIGIILNNRIVLVWNVRVNLILASEKEANLWFFELGFNLNSKYVWFDGFELSSWVTGWQTWKATC